MPLLIHCSRCFFHWYKPNKLSFLYSFSVVYKDIFGSIISEEVDKLGGCLFSVQGARNLHWSKHRRRIQQPSSCNHALPRQHRIFQEDVFVHQRPRRRCNSFHLYSLLYKLKHTSSLIFLKYSGSKLTPSMAIYDTMQSLKSPVGTQCVGYAYNLAAFLLAAGVKV